MKRRRRSDAAVALSVVPDSEMVSEGLATLKEAMAYLSVSSSTLYLMMASELPWVGVRGARRIPWRALRAYATAGLVRQERVS